MQMQIRHGRLRVFLCLDSPGGVDFGKLALLDLRHAINAFLGEGLSWRERVFVYDVFGTLRAPVLPLGHLAALKAIYVLDLLEARLVTIDGETELLDAHLLALVVGEERRVVSIDDSCWTAKVAAVLRAIL